MKILITGVAGFIGFHLAKKLIENGHQISGVDNLSDYYDPNLKKLRLSILKSKNFKFFELDINNINLIDKNFDLVINFAAQAGVRLPEEKKENYVHSNINGFKKVVEFCVENSIKKLIYASSSSVYDDSLSQAFSESDSNLKPKSIYGETKLFNEQYIDKFSRKIESVGLRFFSVYGPYGRPDMAYFSFTESLKKGQIINLHNNGTMARDMTFIDDAVDDISNPEKAKSIPNRVTEVMQEKFTGIEKEVTSALNLADDGSPLSLFLKRQQNSITTLKSELETQMKEIRTALNVDEILQQKDDQIKELKDKSTHKGIYFENDAVEALKQIAASSKWDDEIIHTGGDVVEGSLVKAGDILIRIDNPGNLSIAIEAKSGGIGMTEISREAKRGREARTADAGIGVMTRKARGATQSMLSNVNAGKDTISVVDWTAGEENDDLSAWVSLEVAYVTIRAKLITQHEDYSDQYPLL